MKRIVFPTLVQRYRSGSCVFLKNTRTILVFYGLECLWLFVQSTPQHTGNHTRDSRGVVAEDTAARISYPESYLSDCTCMEQVYIYGPRHHEVFDAADAEKKNLI